MRDLACRLIWPLAALLFLVRAEAGVDLDQQTRNYLEGVWVVASQPAKANCLDSTTGDMQIELEFERSGGRLVVYTPHEVFMPAAITDAERNGDHISLSALSFRSDQPLVMNFRIASPDRMEARVESGATKEITPVTLYRCGLPDHNVTASVPTNYLERLTGTRAEGIIFLETVDSLSDDAICARGGPDRYQGHWLMFDVFGPDYFYVYGNIGDAAWTRKLDQSPIRSITAPDPTTLVVTALERPDGATSWRGGDKARPFTLTLDWHGRHLTVEEMDKTFVRCRQTGNKSEPAPHP